MPTSASLPWTAGPNRRPGSLYAVAAGLLALELLPLGILLWSGWQREPSTGLFLDATLVRATLALAVVFALGATVLGLLAADVPARTRPPGNPWRWWGLVGWLLLPIVVTVALLVPLLTGGPLHDRPWALVFLGIANAQMAAAICLRQAIGAIPANRFQAAALDCVTPGQRLRHVVLPAIAPALGVLAAMTFAGSWSGLLLDAVLRRNPGRFTLGAGLARMGPENFVTATYLFASLAMIFLGLWTLRTCLRSLPALSP